MGLFDQVVINLYFILFLHSYFLLFARLAYIDSKISIQNILTPDVVGFDILLRTQG